MTISRTSLLDLRRILYSIAQIESLKSCTIELHIGTGLLFELVDEIIATLSPPDGPPLTLANLKVPFYFAGVKVFPTAGLGPSFEIRISGGPTTITRGY